MTETLSNPIPADLDTLVSTVEAAAAIGAQPTTVRQWKSRGLIQPAGLDKYSRPLYRLLDVLQAEQKTRQTMMAKATRSRQVAAHAS